MAYTGKEVSKAFKNAMRIHLNTEQEIELSCLARHKDPHALQTLAVMTSLEIQTERICNKLDELKELLSDKSDK